MVESNGEATVASLGSEHEIVRVRVKLYCMQRENILQHAMVSILRNLPAPRVGGSECALRSLALNQCTLEGLLLLGTEEVRQCSPTAPQEPVLSLQQGYVLQLTRTGYAKEKLGLGQKTSFDYSNYSLKHMKEKLWRRPWTGYI